MLRISDRQLDSSFSVDQSVLLAAGDQAGIERLVQYMTRCPFSLARLVKVSDTGQVVDKAEKASCRSFPDPGGDGLRAGTKRNYQILSPLDFLAQFTQHIPAQGSHLIRGHRPKVGHGWYSNKSRGMRKKAAAAARSVAEPSATVGAEEASPSRSRQSWAMLIKRVYEVDPLSCPECGGQMAVVAFIEPPQGPSSKVDRRWTSPRVISANTRRKSNFRSVRSGRPSISFSSFSFSFSISFLPQ